jgi:hypothetical protein
MTVAARQRRVLWRIERMLVRTGPRLAAQFGMFGRLTSGEQIPRIEQLTVRSSRRHRAISRFSRPRYLWQWTGRVEGTSRPHTRRAGC